MATVPRRSRTYDCVRSNNRDELIRSMNQWPTYSRFKLKQTANEAVGQTAASAELASRAAFGNIYSFSFPRTNVLMFRRSSEQSGRETLHQLGVFFAVNLTSFWTICPQPRLANSQRESEVSVFCELSPPTLKRFPAERHNDRTRRRKRLNVDSSLQRKLQWEEEKPVAGFAARHKRAERTDKQTHRETDIKCIARC